jgi:hypothetical protein
MGKVESPKSRSKVEGRTGRPLKTKRNVKHQKCYLCPEPQALPTS